MSPEKTGFISLYNSHICRLCAEENENGYPLYNLDDGEELIVKINTFLPLHISDDGKFPRWICPGCHLQVESTVEFLTLLLSGQETLRILYKAERVAQTEIEKELITPEPSISENYEALEFDDSLENNGSNDMIVSTDQPDQIVSSPKQKKRGRPPKIKTTSSTEELFANTIIASSDITEGEQYEEICGRGKRQIKIPLRYQEVVQGKELDKVYADMGISENAYFNTSVNEVSDNKDLFMEPTEEVIGHVQDDEGINLGDLIVINSDKKNRKLKNKYVKRKTRFMCDICKVCFWQEHKFLQHRFSHQKILFECTQCLQNFKDRNSLLAHQIKESHQGEGIIEDFKSLLLENMDTATNLPDITQANTKQQTISNSFLETNTLQGEYDVNITNMDDIDDPQSISQSNSQDENPLDDVFEEIDEMEEAAKVLHELQKSDSIKLNVSLPNDERISENSNSVPLGQLADESTKNKSESNDKFVPEHKFACNQCTEVFSFEEYIHHKKFEHNTGRRFVCSKCNKAFRSKQLLQRHQLVHSELRPYKCGTCAASFKTKTSLTNHQVSHTDDKKFSCKVCGHKFVHKHSLTLHLRLHTGSKPYKCTECNKGFTQFGNMQEHMRIHTGERPFPCTICTKWFKTSSQCRMHIKRHEVIRPKKCSKCEKSFLNTEDLRVHERRHDNIKPYNCKICEKSFIDLPALKKHNRLHTGEKPFGCTHCGRHFADRSNLSKHQKLHESKKQSSGPEGQTSDHTLIIELPTSLDDQNLIRNDANETTIVGNVFNYLQDNSVNSSDLDLSTTLLKGENCDTDVTKQVVFVTYQDPNNPIGNKTTLYVVQQDN